MRKSLLGMAFSLAMLTLVGCGSIPIGDGGAISMKGDGFTISSGDGQGSLEITVNNDGEMRLSGTDESGEKIEQKVSTEQKLPDGFPQDLPIPEGIELKIIESEIGESIQFIVSYTTEGKVADFYKQYRAYVEQAGYETIIDASDGTAVEDTVLENIMAKSEGVTLSIGMMTKGTGAYDDGTASINIMYMVERE